MMVCTRSPLGWLIVPTASVLILAFLESGITRVRTEGVHRIVKASRSAAGSVCSADITRSDSGCADSRSAVR
jgi:hypothetical protein